MSTLVNPFSRFQLRTREGQRILSSRKRSRVRPDLHVDWLEGRLLLAGSGGLYSIDFQAADAKLYGHYIQGTAAFDTVVASCPTGSTNSDPISGADVGVPSTAVESLEPNRDNLKVGQLVVFTPVITVDPKSTLSNGTISLTADWLSKTTNGADFGYDPAKGVLCAFVDEGDPATQDSGGDAKVDSFTWSNIPPDSTDSNYRIEGTFNLSGLQAGDKVVVDVWMVLDNTINVGTTGNVQSSLVSATALDDGSKINVGNQTVPLQKVQEFLLQPPVANPDTYNCVDAGQTYSVSAPGVLTNDTNPNGNPLTAVLDTSPAHNATSPAFALNSDGSFSYTPDAAYFNGLGDTGSHPTDSFTYYAYDSKLDIDSNTTTVTLVIDRAPTAGGADLGPILPGASATTKDPLVSDPDGDFLSLSSTLDSSIGTLTLNDDGTLTFTAAAGAHGPYTINYTVTDSQNTDGTTNPNGCLSATGTLKVTVNTPPTVSGTTLDCVDVTSGTPAASATGSVAVGDADNDPLTLSQVGTGTNQDGGAAYGTLKFTNNPITVTAGSGTGTFSYTLTALPAGVPTGKHLVDTFTYKANDGTQDSGTSTIVVTLDRAPVTPDSNYSVVMNSPTSVSGNVLSNVSDPDSDVATISAHTSPPAASGTFTFDSTTGAFTFLPASNFSGTVSFTYTVTDSKNADGTANPNGCLSSTGTVTIHVTSAARTQGYWKTHQAAFDAVLALNGLKTLNIGGAEYTSTEAISIMNMSTGTGTSANAILILFDQLVSAKLNVLNDVATSDPDTTAISDGDQAIKDAATQAKVSTSKLVGSKKGTLSWNGTTTVAYVAPSSVPLGQRMVNDASTLNAFNNSGV